MRQLPLPVQLRASSVFANFYSGNNTAAVEQLQNLAPGARQAALWIYGPDSVGKTHLLQAVCAESGLRGYSAAYLPLGDGTLTPDFLAGCDRLNFVCLDDFERAAGHGDWERAVFRLYTELEDSGGRLLISARVLPSMLPIALKDLASRLAASAQLKILALDDTEQCAALTLRAARLGLELPHDVAQFMVRRLPRDMSSLCDALDSLDRASLATQRKLTLPFVRTVLETTRSDPTLNEAEPRTIDDT